MPEETQGNDAPQETGISAEAAQLELGMSLDAEGAPETETPTGAEETPEEETDPEMAPEAMDAVETETDAPVDEE